MYVYTTNRIYAHFIYRQSSVFFLFLLDVFYVFYVI